MSRSPRLGRLDDPAPHARVLSNGSYTVLLTGAGTGFSSSSGAALTSWDADRTLDGLGFFFYWRDLDRDLLWSAGHQPTGIEAASYEATAGPGSVTISRLDHEVETTLGVCVHAERDAEIRRLGVKNRSSEARTIELTSYAELVLAPLAAHRAHPAFSKLFVQTELASAGGALLASRRPRSHSERRVWLAQAMTGDGPLEYETDRARFVGRGGCLATPQALRTRRPLSSTTGNVLDPVFALRRTVRLDAGGSAVFHVVLGLADSCERALALIEAACGEVDQAFKGARDRERKLRRELGLGQRDAESLQELAGRLLYGAPRPKDGETSIPDETVEAYWRALGLDLRREAVAGLADEAPKRRSVRRRRYRRATEEAAVPPAARGEEPLQFDNGFGGFTTDGSHYAIRIPAREKGPALFSAGERGLVPLLTPMPWINVVANERFGFLASESGAGYTWSENSRENRLTPWSNDPVVDPHGEALYVRDEREGIFWSPLPGPAADGAPFEVRHAAGHSRWRHQSFGLEQEVLVFVPRHDPLKITRLTLRNVGKRSRRLSIFAYHHLVLGGLPSETARSVTTEIVADAGAVLARNPRRGEFSGRVAFAAAVPPPGAARLHLSADRTSFLGRNGVASSPAAVAAARVLDEKAGDGLDPCAAMQIEIEIPAAASAECTFLLGEAADGAEARSLIDRYRERGAVDRAFDEVRAFWHETLRTVQVETPSRPIDLMLNGWLMHQILSCRLWGRSAFYQSGGAFGFRDQLQDSAALVYARPDLSRAQILLHARHQFLEGDVLHWWHPPSDRGTRTRCSDDLLWLPYLAAFYVNATGDWAVLDEPCGFVTARPLDPREDETYLQPAPSAESADVYAHCCRAIDRSLAVGAHGLPLIGTCDWNDGMNRVGREGRGESVWLGFFLYAVLADFAAICERRGEAERAERYRQHRERLRMALDEAGWDGEWYRRAYYDDGTPLGSAANDECRIDALAQAWAVISRAAPRQRASQAMDAAERDLVSEQDGLIRLLTPPFDRTPHDPGYIKGYVPGIRENGGQYTHGALWVVRALAELGRNDRAARLLEMLTPVHHALERTAAERYAVEPYVVAADVYGESPHVGRGGWTWYTGSAAWMYRVALESVLGFTLEDGKAIRLKPCIPDEWPGFHVRYRPPGEKTRYEIVVENPASSARAVVSVTIDGAPGTIDDGVAKIPLVHDGHAHHARVILGSKP